MEEERNDSSNEKQADVDLREELNNRYESVVRKRPMNKSNGAKGASKKKKKVLEAEEKKKRMGSKKEQVVCNICDESCPFDLVVSCKQCDPQLTCCMDCFAKYALSKGTLPIKCMQPSCSKTYRRTEFVGGGSDRMFTFENVVAEIQLRQEKKKTQDVMDLVQHYTNMHRAKEAKVPLEKELERAKNEVNRIYFRMRAESDIIDRYESEKRKLTHRKENAAAESKKDRVLCHCPKESCRGFVLHKSLKCGICNQKVCKKCEVPVDDADRQQQHTCDPNLVETVESIRKECKPCPSCEASIYKTEGCDQMFCTQCNTAFSWQTLQIEQGTIHNPHYFEWRANQARQQSNLQRAMGTFGAGGACVIRDMLQYEHIRHVAKEKLGCNAAEMERFEHLLRRVYEIRDNNERNVPRNIVEERKLIDLRVRYLNNEFDDDDYKRRIKLIHKRVEKEFGIYQTYQTFTEGTIDILVIFVNHTPALLDNQSSDLDLDEARKKILDGLENEILELCRLCNEALNESSKSFNTVLAVPIDLETLYVPKKTWEKFNENKRIRVSRYHVFPKKKKTHLKIFPLFRAQQKHHDEDDDDDESDDNDSESDDEIDHHYDQFQEQAQLQEALNTSYHMFTATQRSASSSAVARALYANNFMDLTNDED